MAILADGRGTAAPKGGGGKGKGKGKGGNVGRRPRPPITSPVPTTPSDESVSPPSPPSTFVPNGRSVRMHVVPEGIHMVYDSIPVATPGGGNGSGPPQAGRDKGKGGGKVSPPSRPRKPTGAPGRRM